jgi:hypothetical protein
VGLYAGALIVALGLAPAAAMRRYTKGRTLPFVACGLAIVAAGLASIPSQAGLKLLLVPFLVLGVAVGTLLLWRPERRERVERQ